VTTARAGSWRTTLGSRAAPHPGATAVVTAALDDFLGEPGVGTGTYGHLCNFVHPGLPGAAMLFNAGLAAGEPNIKLAGYGFPVAAASHGMIHAVNRQADYMGLASPAPYTAPIQDASQRCSTCPEKRCYASSPEQLAEPPITTARTGHSQRLRAHISRSALDEVGIG